MSTFLLDFADKIADRDDDIVAGEIEASAFLASSNATGSDFTDENEYCSIPTEIFGNFSAKGFQNTNIIKWMNSIPPRFGRTSDVLDLVIGTEQQQREYVTGLMASSIVLLFFFLGWAALLLLFKCLAPSNAGNSTRWLGGKPLRMPSPPLDRNEHYDKYQRKSQQYAPSKGDAEEYKDWKREYNATKFQLNCFRVVVWIAGLSVVISALVMSVYGVDSLSNTLEAGREALGIVKNLAGDAQSIVDSVIAQNEDLSGRVYGMLDAVNGMCPNVKDPLCDNIYDIETCEIGSFLGSEMNDVFQMAASHFVQGEQSEYYKEIVNAKNGLEEVQTLSQDMDRSASQLNWALTLSMVMSLFLAILCLLILCGLVCPDMPRVLQCLHSKVTIPAFCVLVFFAYLFSLVFVTASVVTADVCIFHNNTNNIDERIMTVLSKSDDVEALLGGEETQNLVTEFIGFYIHQCPMELLPQEILEQLEYIKVGVPVIKQFSTIVEQSTGLIQDVCGFQENQTQSLVDVADTLQDQLCAVASILTDVRDYIQCDNWYPLYETTVYQALCYDGTEGFAYVATTQFVITFMAFVILTFRVAFWDITVGDQYYNFLDDDSEDRESYSSEDETDGDGNHYYYKGLRDKIASTRATGMENQMDELRESQWHERQEHERLAAEKETEESPSTVKRTSFFSRLRSPSSLDKTIDTSPATNSYSFEESFHEDPAHEGKIIARSDAGIRNSRYPSRFPGNIERDRNPEHKNPISSLQSQTFVGGSGTTFDGEDGGIEVEHLPCNFRTDIRNFGRSCNYISSSSSSANSGSSHRRSRALDATSLWVREHQDNIDYCDSEGETEYYSKDSTNVN